jgi:hypothetical protein
MRAKYLEDRDPRHGLGKELNILEVVRMYGKD